MKTKFSITVFVFVFFGYLTTVPAQTPQQKPEQTQKPQVQERPLVIGKMKAKEAAERLEEFGETGEAAKIKRALTRQNENADLATVLAGRLKPWECTSHAFGFIGATQGGESTINIVDAR